MPREQSRASSASARTAGRHHRVLGSTGAGTGLTQLTCVCRLLAVFSCVSLSKWFHLSEPPLPPVHNKGSKLMELLRR